MKTELSQTVRLAWPATVSFVSFTMMEVLDCAMLGAVGVGPMAGAALASTVLCLVMAFPANMLRAMAPVTASVTGQGHARGPHAGPLRSLARLTARVSLLSGLVASLVGLAGMLALGAFGYEPGLAASARTYLLWRSPFLFLDLLFAGGWALLEGLDDTRSPMVAGILANVVNVLLNLWLIPLLGVRGAASATTLATLAGLLLIGRALRHARAGANRGPAAGEEPGREARAVPDAGRTGGGPSQRFLLHRFLRTGWPMGTAGLFELLGALVLGLLVARYGAVSSAAHGVLVRLTALAVAPASGLSVAMQVLVARCLGKRDVPGARRRVGLVLRLQLAAGTLAGLGLLAAGSRLMCLFSQDPGVRATGAQLLPLCALIVWVEGFFAVSGSVLEGAGRTRMLFVSTVICDLGAAALLLAFPGMGMQACYTLWLSRNILKAALLLQTVGMLGLLPRPARSSPPPLLAAVPLLPGAVTWPARFQAARSHASLPLPPRWSLPLPDR